MASQREQAQAMSLLNENPEVALSYAREVLKREDRLRGAVPSPVDAMWKDAEELLIAQVTHLIHVRIANERATHQAYLAPQIEHLDVAFKIDFVKVVPG